MVQDKTTRQGTELFKMRRSCRALEQFKDYKERARVVSRNGHERGRDFYPMWKTDMQSCGLERLGNLRDRDREGERVFTQNGDNG